jgi:assimilatory nitrate reductase catalytic subunit
MGFGAAFSYADASEIFREHAKLSALANPDRPLNLGALADLDRAAYDALEPVQWPRPSGGPGTDPRRVFANGNFATPDGRARFVATPWNGKRTPGRADFPLILNTGRIRDQWHTLTRSGKSPRLWTHIAEPYVEIAPSDAAACGIEPATIVKVTSEWGSVLLRALITEAQRPGSVFVPMHWTDQYAAAARIDALVDPSVDPHSGQPGLKHTPVNIAPVEMAWYGFALLRDQPKSLPADYWALSRTKAGFRLELAGRAPLEDPVAFAADLFGVSSTAPLLSYRDPRAAQFRFALELDGVLRGALYLAPEAVTVSRSWAVDVFDQTEPSAPAGLQLLAGRPGGRGGDRGAIICACNNVGMNQIVAAVAAGATTLIEIGEATSAGTNCGSCRAEVGRVLGPSPSHTAAVAT